MSNNGRGIVYLALRPEDIGKEFRYSSCLFGGDNGEPVLLDKPLLCFYNDNRSRPSELGQILQRTFSDYRKLLGLMLLADSYGDLSGTPSKKGRYFDCSYTPAPLVRGCVSNIDFPELYEFPGNVESIRLLWKGNSSTGNIDFLADNIYFYTLKGEWLYRTRLDDHWYRLSDIDYYWSEIRRCGSLYLPSPKIYRRS